MTSTYVIRFDEPTSDTHHLTGGKGANLGKLTHAGFPVPGGFTVTTDAYSAFMAGELAGRVGALVDKLDYDDAEALEATTNEIRDLIESAPMPDALVAQIRSSYVALGDGVFVAVRSSGTAEDLAEASFAGMHDTYLDIEGPERVLDAIRRCWASLWTARATSYRHARGFGHGNGIAVVVQIMVPSEVSGVMFTANPMTTATDEIVINASWGLGEAIVSGITTPDEFIVDATAMYVKERLIGSKERQVVRDPQTGRGTVVLDTPDADRERPSLTDAQAAELARLGLRVQKHYGDFPQDTEWAFAGGEFFLLQSRPVTGVDLSWDADVDAWQWLPPVDDDTVWTRSWSDEVWTGAITPLFYSYRAKTFSFSSEACLTLWGHADLAQMRMWKYHKGGAYYNSNLDRGIVSRTAFPSTRIGMLANMPPVWHQDVLSAPFSLGGYFNMHLRMQLIDKINGLFTWEKQNIDRYMVGSLEKANGLTPAELMELTDAALVAHIDDVHTVENAYVRDVWTAFFIHARDMFGAVGTMLGKWYKGSQVITFADLFTGTPKPTATMIENREMWHLAEELRASPVLMKLFRENEDAAFFEAVGNTEEGRVWLAKYAEFVERHGHRGHADRDFWYTRRFEDPSVDYRSFASFLSVETPVDPQIKEHEVEARRQETIQMVVADIRCRPFGGVRAELFKLALEGAEKFLLFRDDERHWVDRSTFSMKRGVCEIGRRLRERGILEGENDHYFLTRDELLSLLRGDTGNLPLVKAKIAGRSKAFYRILDRQGANPLYLRRNKNVDAELTLASGEELPDGQYRGVGTSGGSIEGVARIVMTLKEIGRVKDGEILVTNSTDPGWTPVFGLLSGIVLETGGLLAHGSCLAREYGMPAVQLTGAGSKIPDGARIRINGDSGLVELLDGVVDVEASEVLASAL